MTIENPENKNNQSTNKINSSFKHNNKEINYLFQYFTLTGDNLY